MCAIIVCFCCCTLLHVAACWLNVHQETLESDERPSELSDITEEPEEYQDCSSDEVNTGRNLSNKRQGEGKSFLFLFYFSIYFPHLTVRRLGFSPVALIIHIYVFLFFSPSFCECVCGWLCGLRSYRSKLHDSIFKRLIDDVFFRLFIFSSSSLFLLNNTKFVTACSASGGYQIGHQRCCVRYKFFIKNSPTISVFSF